MIVNPLPMPGRRFVLLAGLALGAVLAGCASPNPALYALAAVPGAAQATPARRIKLRRVGLAGYLDRSEIVLGQSGYRLQVTDQARWAAPLAEMISNVLAEDLAQRLPGCSVFTDQGAISTEADLRVEIDIQHLDADPAGVVTLLAQMALLPAQGEGGQGQASNHAFRLTHPAGGTDAPAQVAAISAMLGALADRIAALVVGG